MGTKDSIDEFVERACRIFPRLDPEVEGAVDRICKLNKRFDTMLEHAVEAFDLNKGEFRLLITLRQHNDDFTMSPGELGDELLLSSGAMTNRLDRLESAGLIAREPDPDDRRALIVRLTPEGQRRIDEAVNAAAHNEFAVVSVLTPAEQRRLNSLLRKLMLSFEVKPMAVAAGRLDRPSRRAPPSLRRVPRGDAFHERSEALRERTTADVQHVLRVLLAPVRQVVAPRHAPRRRPPRPSRA